MKNFKDIFDQFDWNEVTDSIYAKTPQDVELALNKSDNRDIEDFKALISPAATPYLEQMAQLSNRLTLERFGKTIQMYVPMYLSNECQNICTYCGFSYDNRIEPVLPTVLFEEKAFELEMIKQETIRIGSGDR